MFKDRIKFLRNKANLTQKELADRLNLTRSALSLYELGKRDPDTETIGLFADFFNVSVDYLLGRTDVPSQSMVIKEEKQNNPLLDKIESLNDESKKDLEQYIQFLKIKEEMDKGKDETSSTLERNA